MNQKLPPQILTLSSLGEKPQLSCVKSSAHLYVQKAQFLFHHAIVIYIYIYIYIIIIVLNYFIIIIVNYFKDIFCARVTNFLSFPIKYFM